MAACPLGAQEAGGGEGSFHGHPWGTLPEDIPLLAGERPWEQTPDGERIYVTDFRFLGMPTRAVFRFGSGNEGLRGGTYLARPEGLSCVAQFRTVRLMAAAERSGDSLSLQRGSGRRAGDLRTACRDFLDAEEAAEWTAVFRDASSGTVSARIRLLRPGGEARIVACYGETNGCRWPAGTEIEEGPVMTPARRDTSTYQP